MRQVTLRRFMPSSRLLGSLAAMSLWVGASLPCFADAKTGLDGFKENVAPFFQQHCISCHGPDKQKAKLALHQINPGLAAGKDKDKWKLVAERLAANEMPPEKAPRPDAKATAHVLKWIKSELGRAGGNPAEIG